MDAFTLDGAAQTAPARKPLPYSPLKNAVEVEVGTTGEDGIVFKSKNKDGDGFLTHQNGRYQQSVPLRAVAAAIKGGSITTQEIESLLGRKFEKASAK